jgi:hypothetical protein
MGTTLQQFLNSRADLDEHRTGADVYPDKEQSAEITRRALAAGIQASAINDVFEAYTGNPKLKRKPEFDLNDMDLWLEKQKIVRPHLFPTVGVFALAAEAFCGELNLTVRSRLVNEVGEKEADNLAKQFGLSSLQDFKTKGVTPDPANVSLSAEQQKLEAELASVQAKLDQVRKAQPQPEKSSNPFTKLSNPATREAALKQISSMIVAMGSARVAAIAASCGRRLDGSLIPAKFK